MKGTGSPLQLCLLPKVNPAQVFLAASSRGPKILESIKLLKFSKVIFVVVQFLSVFVISFLIVFLMLFARSLEKASAKVSQIDSL